MAEEFQPITTQEAFDAAIKGRLERQAKHYEGFTSPDDVAAMKQNYEQQIASLSGQIEEAGKKAADYEKTIAERDATIKGHESRRIRERIAIASGLGYDAADFLRGETEDDITASAESLKNIIGAQNKVPSYTPNEGVKTSTSASLQKLAAGLSSN